MVCCLRQYQRHRSIYSKYIILLDIKFISFKLLRFSLITATVTVSSLSFLHTQTHTYTYIYNYNGVGSLILS